MEVSNEIGMGHGLIVGIDVGGTYTDAVLLERTGDETARVLSFSKKPTEASNLAGAIIAAFEGLFEGRPGCSPPAVERIVVSTTLCTNAVVSGKFERVGALVMPGPGLSPGDLERMAGIDGDVFHLAEVAGYVDHRGREVKPLDPAEAGKALEALRSRGLENLAIVGKFGVRNPAHEKQVAGIARAVGGFRHVTMGHTLSGILGLPRRVATACLNSAVAETYSEFVTGLERAFSERDVSCPVMILKADGGTMDVQSSAAMPVKTILSGPAASITGSLALAPSRGAGITIDIGGTTTDVSFFIDGQPLFEAKGAEIAGRKTLVRAMYSRSLALGGDTPVVGGPEGGLGGPRKGVAAAFGGPAATLTDALIVAGLANAGDSSRSWISIDAEARRYGLDAVQFANSSVRHAVGRIVEFARRLLDGLRRAPVYTVREALSPAGFAPEVVIGIGAPAASMIPLVARELGVEPVVPPLAAVGNAVGAALAVPTVEATVRIDTAEGFAAVAEEGLREQLETRYIREQEAAEMAKSYVLRRAAWAGVEDVEVTEVQSFNVVRDFHTTGRIFDVKAQVKPRALRLSGAGGEGAVAHD